jgi:ribosomal protein S24E
MLVQMTNALRQEKEVGQTLKTALQDKVHILHNELTATINNLMDMQKSLEILTREIEEEFGARESAINQLIGE